MKEYYILLKNVNCNDKELSKVKGYNIDEYCFIYYDRNQPVWYVINKDTGYFVALGTTKEKALKEYNQYKKELMLKIIDTPRILKLKEDFEKLKKEATENENQD